MFKIHITRWLVVVGLVYGLAGLAAARGNALAAAIMRALDSRGTNSPMFILSGTADQRGNVWIGSEGEGIWRFSADATTTFTTEDGLGDNDGNAMACDALGRIWVGHSSHGVSVFNGKQWRNYGWADGPSGSHVYCIVNCPKDDELWIATEGGLSRYLCKDDKWLYLDRSTGMPDDQASSLAFDLDGNVYVGLQCGGIAMANRADGYKTWKQVTGPDIMPITPTGIGLPAPLVNAILVGRNGTIYAGTTRGLAYSADHGQSWKYMRGSNWAQLARDRYDGAPKNLPAEITALPEDWVTSLAEEPPGSLTVGLRELGSVVLSTEALQAHFGGDDAVHTLIPLAGAGVLVGSYGQGLVATADLNAQADDHPAPPAAATPNNPPWPVPATAPDADALHDLLQRVSALGPAPTRVSVLTDDWQTKGDWMGRYGRTVAYFCNYRTFMGGGDDMIRHAGYEVSVFTGPYRPNALMRTYQPYLSSIKNLENVLFIPARGQRVMGEINDESYDAKKFPRTMEGPDLYVNLRLPAGNHRVSLYFFNKDGHRGQNILRDYYIQAKRPGDGHEVENPAPDVDDSAGLRRDYGSQGWIGAELAATDGRMRVPGFWNGVYKRLLIRGPGTFFIKIGRNHSFGTILQGVFIDREGDATADAQPVTYQGVPPIVVPKGIADWPEGSLRGQQAVTLWVALNEAADKQGYAQISGPMRLAAYRAALAEHADESLLANWRWHLCSWTAADHQQMDDWITKASAKPDDDAN